MHLQYFKLPKSIGRAYLGQPLKVTFTAHKHSELLNYNSDLINFVTKKPYEIYNTSNCDQPILPISQSSQFTYATV